MAVNQMQGRAPFKLNQITKIELARDRIMNLSPQNQLALNPKRVLSLDHHPRLHNQLVPEDK